MTAKTVQTEETYIRLPIPLGDPDAFRYGATADIVHLLADNPDREFTNRELHRVTERGLSSVNAAVDVLESLGVVSVDRSGRANGVQIDPAMLVKADDPITTIPQAEYHTPVRTTVTELNEQLSQDIGIVLFGSVARGTADRTSDIDLFVVVDENRRQAQREAHRIEREIANTSIDGDRYEAHIIVEPSTSAGSHDRIGEILTEGLTLRDSPALKTVKQEVFHSGSH